MANLSPSFYLLLLLLILTSERSMVNGYDCMVAVADGGCPDVHKCLNDICRPCYRGIGRIKAACTSASGGFPITECLCLFSNGAPCNPPAPPRCPGPSAVVTRVISNTTRM